MPSCDRVLATECGSVHRMRPGAPGPADDQADEQRAAGEAEGELPAAGQRELQLAEQHAEGQAQGQARDRVGRGTALGVAEELGDVLHARTRGDDADAVADLQHEVVGGEQVDVATTHAGGDGAEPAAQVQALQRLARDLGVRDGDAPVVDLASGRG